MTNSINRSLPLYSCSGMYYDYEEECSLINQWKCKVVCQLQKHKMIYNETKENLLERVNLNLENTLCYINLIKSKIIKKGSDGVENTIDAFEELFSYFKIKTQYFTTKDGLENDINYFSENLQDRFEYASDQWKSYMQDYKEEISFTINAKKESVIDDFEDILGSVKNISTPTKFADFKEEIIDMFDSVVKSCNDFIVSTEEHIKYTTNKQIDDLANGFEDIVDGVKDKIENVNFVLNNQKDMIADIVDDVGDVIENTRYMLETKKAELEFHAECAFDDVLDQTKQIVSETKQSVNTELNHLDYIISLTEFLLKDFICFSEELLNDFAVFSESQLDYYLSIGSEKFQELYAIHLFYSEVVDSLVRGYDDRLPCDNLVLEINSSRYAYNVSMSEVNVHVVRALLTLIPPGGWSWQQLAARLAYFTPILTNYIRSPNAQRDCLAGIEDVAGTHPEIFDVTVKILHWLYDKDILSEELILNWYSNPNQDSDASNGKRVRDQVTPFISWLKEAEEQSSDSDDED